MLKYLSLTLLVFIQVTLIHAQVATNGMISGQVQLENNKPALNATVVLQRSADSVLVKTALPNEDGVFEFENIKPGAYVVAVSQVGYGKIKSEVLNIKESYQMVKLPLIVLSPQVQSLTGVTIEAKKPFIERKLDKLVVNVENSIASAGSSVLEVLERAPGVMVNQESSINLKGKQGVVVMIDGKPSPLSGADLVAYLKSIPASNIATIEIITQPSARYDAAGNAGIINIKFKKDQRQGLNGALTLSLGQGFYSKPSASTNANFRVFIPISIKKWLNSNLNASVYRNQYSSPLQGGNLINDFTAWDASLNNTITLGKGWSAELSGFYQSKNAWGLFIIRNLAQVSSGIQKVSKDKNATFKLAISDIFYTNRIAVLVKYQNMDFFTDRTWDSKVVTASFTQRFGKNTIARARQRNSGVEDERRRVG